MPLVFRVSPSTPGNASDARGRGPIGWTLPLVSLVLHAHSQIDDDDALTRFGLSR